MKLVRTRVKSSSEIHRYYVINCIGNDAYIRSTTKPNFRRLSEKDLKDKPIIKLANSNIEKVRGIKIFTIKKGKDH